MNKTPWSAIPDIDPDQILIDPCDQTPLFDEDNDIEDDSAPVRELFLGSD